MSLLKGFSTDFFDMVAHIYDSIGPGFFSYFGKRLVDLADVKKGSTILDVATGRGAVLFPVVEKTGTEGLQ